MKNRLALAALLLMGSAAFAQPTASADGGFSIYVVDRDVDATAFELVTQDTGFTQLTTASIINVAWSAPGTAADTARIYVSGIRQKAGSDSLQRVVRSVKVIGNDTVEVNSTDTLIAYETAWLDTPIAHSIIVFSSAASARNSMLDTLAANTYSSPKAHVFSGRSKRGQVENLVIDYVDAQLLSGAPATCEFRTYRGVHRAVNYNAKYVVAAVADSSTMSAGGFFSTDWGGRGLYLGEQSYAAWVCKGAAADADVGVTIVGRR
jgi:hypothetical protein